MNIKPIAVFKSPFSSKFGIPRQSGLVPELEGRIVFEPWCRNADAVRGLEGFDYIWLVWGFSANQRGAACRAAGPETGSNPSDATKFQPTVRPPRLGGNVRIGVFASRSPFRPNGLGLSSVRLESISYDEKDCIGKALGPVINVLGADLMDGTPIYDIKPYIEYTDSHPGARSGFVDAHEWKPLQVVVPEEFASISLDWDILRQVLSQDPRPRYQDDPGKTYGMPFGGYDIIFRVQGRTLTIVALNPLQSS